MKTKNIGNDHGGELQILESSQLRLEFDLRTMKFAVLRRSDCQILLSEAGTRSDVTRFPAILSDAASLIDRTDTAGDQPHKLRMEFRGEDGVNLIWEAVIDPELPVISFRMGVHNLSPNAVRVRQASPCYEGLFLPGKARSSHGGLTLDGLAGAGCNQIKSGLQSESPNNLLLYLPEHNRCLVAGGATYRDFAKYFSTSASEEPDGVRLTMEARDPVGRFVEVGEYYLPDDWFYLDLAGKCPFDALEQFGKWVRRINSAAPCSYTFPTVCGWCASVPVFGAGEWINHTTGLVEEIEGAGQVGFLRYSRVGVRVVPDVYDLPSYGGRDPRDAGLDPRMWSSDRNTEQGWWDDEHWERFGHYTKPYETSAKWAQAVLERGGIPLTYVQTGHVSYDYAKLHPEHMLGNDISRLDEIFPGHHPFVKYDYTDPGFRDHLRKVWSRLGKAGVQGVFFDYPDQGWIETGGFEDPKATTTSAYRAVFDLVKPALGKETYIQERNVSRKVPYLDVTVGLVDSQRVWCDTDAVSSEMFRMCALRWYKTRTLYTYDTDSKNLLKIAAKGRDFLRQVLTMLYLTTGRILLANSFRVLSADVLHDLSRLFPCHEQPLTPRPLDAFTGIEIPRVYGLALTPDWYQVAFYNVSDSEEVDFVLPLQGRSVDGALNLPEKTSWYVWDFWNDCLAGVFADTDTLRQRLRPYETRMLSLRRRLDHPQVISTNRHLLQGWVELSEIVWDPHTRVLSGGLMAVAGEETIITVTGSSKTACRVSADRGVARIVPTRDNESEFVRIGLKPEEGGLVRWAITFD